eukprot:COSAG01_NODE_7536_length_3161_cov_1.530372_2_plen_104_part_00
MSCPKKNRCVARGMLVHPATCAAYARELQKQLAVAQMGLKVHIQRIVSRRRHDSCVGYRDEGGLNQCSLRKRNLAISRKGGGGGRTAAAVVVAAAVAPCTGWS